MTTGRSLLGYGMVVAALALVVLSGYVKHRADVPSVPPVVTVQPPQPEPPPAVEPAPAPKPKVKKPRKPKPVRKPRRTCENGWCWTQW